MILTDINQYLTDPSKGLVFNIGKYQLAMYRLTSVKYWYTFFHSQKCLTNINWYFYVIKNIG